MKDLHIDDQLLSMVADDQNADRTTAGVKRLAQAGPEVRLVDDGEAGFDIASLGHSSQSTIMHIEHTILLEDRPQHGLDNNIRAGVGDKTRLLVQLLAEQIHAQVAVLARRCGGADADHLARTALEDQNITHVDVVARDGDGVGVAGRGRRRRGNGAMLLMVVVRARDFNVDFLTTAKGTVSCLVEFMAERVVAAVFVVVAHFW